MNTNAVNVAVVDGKTITESVELRTTKQGDPVRIKAVKDGKYILAEGGDKPVAPENLTIKRVGNDLHVATEGTDPDQPQLIIEGFYESQGQLVGVAEDGAYYEYISSDAESDHAAAFLSDGVSSPQVLGSDELVGFGNGLVAGGGIGWFWPALLGLGALGLLGAAYKLTRDDDDKHSDGGKAGLDTPTVGGATDNVGAVQGPIDKGGATDDTTPTFGGTGTPGNIIIIEDNGKQIGEVVVGDDGKWEFTPVTPLPEGEHSIIVVEKDKDGNVSKPSDEFDFIVDITAPGKSAIDSVVDDFGASQGPIANNGRTDDNTPTLNGTAEAGAQLDIYDNGVKIGETVVNADGTWSFTPSPALADGSHSFTTVAIDAAGNAGLPSAPHIITIDTGTGPVKPGIGTGGIEEANDNVGPITGDIGNGGTTDDTTPTFTGGGLQPGEKVTIIDNGVVIGEVIVDEDGRWEFTPDPELADGSHPITVIVTDLVGNESEPSDPYIVIVDTQAPIAPTIDGVFDDQGTTTGNINPGDTTDDAQPEISGQAEPGSVVIIYDNGIEIGRAPVDADGMWTYTPVPPLLNGPHDLTAKAVDAAGNVSDPSNNVDFDLVAGGVPPAPSITGVWDDVADEIGNIMPGESTNDGQPDVSGTAEPFTTVTLYVNGMAAGTAVADEFGAWTITPTPALTAGLNNLTATSTNDAGNESPPTGNYPITVDTTAPVAADASLLTDDEGAVTGPINSGDTTDDSTPTFSGTAEANTTLIIFNNGVEIGRVPVNATGNWSFTPAPALADGNHSFSSVVVDGAGNRSPESTPVDFIVDTSAVTISIGLVLDNVGPNQGPISNGGVTDDTTPTLSGQATPGATVNIYLNGVLLQADVPVNGQGNWIWTVNPALPEGEHAFTATVVTPAGGESLPTAEFNLEVDLTASPPPTIEDVRDDVGDFQGSLADGATTDDTTPTLEGRGVAGDLVIIRNNGTEIGREMVGADGRWSFTPNPPLNNASTNVFDVIAQDPAGNQSAPSDPWTIIIDTVAPLAPTIDGVFDDQGTTTGNINPGDITDDAQPEISGQAEPGSVVIIYDNGTEIGRAPVDGNGNWTYMPVPPLLNGPHDLTARAEDAAGNVSAPSNNVDFDLVAGGLPPAPSITGVWDDVADGVGNIMPGESTNDTEPDVSGTAEPFTTVTLYVNGIAAGTAVADEFGAWTITPAPALTAGLNILTATATNAAGNESPPTGEYPLDVDVTPPAAADASLLTDDVGAITGPINSGDTTDDSTPTFSGTAEANTTLIIFNNGVEIGRVPVNATGNWSFTPAPALADGNHSFSSVVVDGAGNRSPESTPVDFTVDTSAVMISIDQVEDNAGPNQGPIANGSVTDDTTPTLSGRATAGATVNIYLNGVLLQADVPVNAQGNWTYTVAPALAEGEHAFTATVVTPASGESLPTAEFNLEVDLTPSAAPVIDEIRDDVGDIQDPLQDGSTTDDTTPTLVGRGEAGDTIIIRINGAEIGRAPVLADGTWSFTPNPPLNDGSINEFDVIAQDPAGNQSAPSDSWTIIIDTEAPTTSAIVESMGKDSGADSGDFITNDGSAGRLIQGSLSAALVAGEKVQVSTDGGATWLDALLNADDTWSFVDKNTHTGDWTIQTRVTDAAGNANATSQLVTFDNLAPDSPDTFSLSGATVTVNFDGGSLSEGDVLLVVVGDERFEVSLTQAQIDAGTVDVMTVPNATILNVSIAIVDQVGNVSEYLISDRHEMNFDNVPPGGVPVGNTQDFGLFTFTWDGTGSTPTNPTGVLEGGTLVNGAGGFITPSRGLAFSGGSFLTLASGTQANAISFKLGDPNNPLTVRFLGADGTEVHTLTVPAGLGTLEQVHLQLPPGILFSTVLFDSQPGDWLWIDDVEFSTGSFAHIAPPALQEVEGTGSYYGDEVDNTFVLADVSNLDDAGSVINGGAGIDTLSLTGAGQVLDLGAIAGQLKSIEIIDITGTGNNTLNLSLGDVLELGESSLFTSDDNVQMMIKGNAGDVVNLDDLLADGTDPGDWAGQGQVTVEGLVYNVFQHSSLDAQLLVQDGVTTNLV